MTQTYDSYFFNDRKTKTAKIIDNKSGNIQLDNGILTKIITSSHPKVYFSKFNLVKNN